MTVQGEHKAETIARGDLSSAHRWKGPLLAASLANELHRGAGGEGGCFDIKDSSPLRLW